MSNEITKKESTEIANGVFGTGELVTPEDTANLSVGKTFIPQLKIAYGSSPEVTERKASAGDLVYNGESLGQETELIVLDHRFHAAYQNPGDNYKMTDHYFKMRGEGSAESDPEYKTFCNSVPAGQKLLTGTDVFCYIPSLNGFACFYMKQTLKGSVNSLFEASSGFRLVNIKSVPLKGKSHWYYVIESKPKNQAASHSKLTGVEKNISIPVDLYLKYKEIFDKPNNGVEKAPTEAEQFDR